MTPFGNHVVAGMTISPSLNGGTPQTPQQQQPQGQQQPQDPYSGRSTSPWPPGGKL
jgi:hypothetical protein